MRQLVGRSSEIRTNLQVFTSIFLEGPLNYATLISHNLILNPFPGLDEKQLPGPGCGEACTPVIVIVAPKKWRQEGPRTCSQPRAS